MYWISNVIFFTVLFFTVLLIGPLGGSEATRLQEDVEATHVLVVAIATSQEIGKFFTYFIQLFGKILKTVGSQCSCGVHSI